MHKPQREKGAVVPMLAVLMPAMIAGLGLAVDTGSYYEINRRMQTASDAAALAAAQELRAERYDEIEDAAVFSAEENGFSSDEVTEVHVNRPPTSGAYAGDNKYVEVVINQTAPLYFMGAFVQNEYTIASRAVASASPSPACVIALNDSEPESFEASGSANVNLGNCGIHVNSDHPNAASATGSSSVAGTGVNIVGDFTGEGFSPEPMTGAYPLDDPFADFELPSFGSCDSPKTMKINTEVTLSPGVYCGGLELTGQADVTLQPGTYVLMGGGLTAHGGTEISGDEVTFINTAKPGNPYDRINLNAGVSAQLSAPTSGTYKGILFFQDRDYSSNKENLFNGGGSMDLSGTLYFPTTDVKFSGNFGSTAMDLLVVADKVEFSGNASFTALSDDFTPSALMVAHVVE